MADSESPAQRHSRANEAELITDPLFKAEAEALKGLRQFDAWPAITHAAVERDHLWFTGVADERPVRGYSFASPAPLNGHSYKFTTSIRRTRAPAFGGFLNVKCDVTNRGRNVVNAHNRQ